MSSTNLYFCFPDGVLHHVCAECTALCCRGFGFGGSLDRQMRPLFALYPALEATVVSRSGDTVELSTPASGCHFLRSDNMCGIEAEHGKAAKPGICSLFPFNLLRRIGSMIVVGPNFLCPLRVVVPADPGRVEGSHEALADAVASSSLLGIDGRGTHLPSVPARPGVSPAKVVAAEVAFRDACAAALGRRTFHDVLREASGDAASFDDSVRRIASLAGLAPARTGHGRDVLDDVLLAVAPTLRLDYLRLSPAAVLRALATIEMFVRTESSLSSRIEDPQVLFRNAALRKAAVQLLAHGDEPLALRRALHAKAPPFNDPQLTFAAFRALRGLGSGAGVAGVLESAVPDEMAVSDRVTMFMSLGGTIDPLLARRRDGAN